MQATPTVFITGASSGLGRALAQEYAAQGACLALLGRRQEELQALADSLPGSHRVYVADVRDRDALHQAAQDFLQFTGQKIDVVIASAGISAGTLTEETQDFAVFKAIVDINLLAMVATFEPFIATMKTAGKGSLVGIASVAGIRGLPGAGAYSSSKAAVIAYCESLRLELSLYGVSVVTITPGYIRTAMTAHNPYSMPFLMPAEDFARKARKTIERGASYRVIPWPMGIVSRLMRLLPNWLYDHLARRAPRKPRLKKDS